MQDSKCLNYDNIFEILKNIILKRDFKEIINFETILKENKVLTEGESNYFTKEIEIIGLCAMYIFCVMLKQDEENIFPYLREYVLKLITSAALPITEESAQNQLNNFYNLKNNTIEQRYLYLMALKGFNVFNSGIDLESNIFKEYDEAIVKKLLQKIFLTNYTQFNTTIIQGLFLLYRYEVKINKSNWDPSTQLCFEVVLKRTGDILSCWYDNRSLHEGNDEEEQSLNKFDIESNAMNLI